MHLRECKWRRDMQLLFPFTSVEDRGSSEASLGLLRTVSQMASQGWILAVSSVQTLMREEEWNLIWIGRREDGKMVISVLSI